MRDGGGCGVHPRPLLNAPCADARGQLTKAAGEREALIEMCAQWHSANVLSLVDDGTGERQAAQRALRMVERQRMAENILQKQTKRAFDERCTQHL